MKKIIKKITRMSFLFVLFFISWFLIHSTIITIDGLTDTTKNNADMVVILGNKVNENGLPSDRLAARLDKGVGLYDTQKAKYILVSGGTGETGFKESEVMKKYLVDAGIPSSLIFEDGAGVNTGATAENIKLILKENDLSSVIIVSQFYHITRTRYAFKKSDVLVVGSAHAQFFEARDLYSMVREFLAFYKYFFFFKG